MYTIHRWFLRQKKGPLGLFSSKLSSELIYLINENKEKIEWFNHVTVITEIHIIICLLHVECST